MTVRERIRQALSHPSVTAGFVGLLCTALYWRTLAPTVTWYDMAELPAAAYFLGIAHGTGYPLYLLLGKLFTFVPLGDIGYRVNLMSAFFATLTVIIVFFIVWDHTRHRAAAALAATMLGVASTFWGVATQAEVHALNAFFTAWLTYLVVAWGRSACKIPLFIASYLLGLAMGNHHLIQFFALAMLAYWGHVNWLRGRRLPWRSLSVPALLFLSGFAVNLYLPIRAAQQPVIMSVDAAAWPTFWRMITTGQSSDGVGGLYSLDPATLWGRLRILAPYPVYEFTAPGLMLAMVGAVRLWQRDRSFAVYAFLGSAMTVAFTLSYGIHDIYQYLLPVYVMISIWLGIGVSDCLRRVTALSFSAGRTVQKLSGLLPGMSVGAMGVLLLALPCYLVYRDFSVLDRSQDDPSYLCANYLMGRLEPNARLLTDFWTWSPLVYYRTLAGWRPDVLLYGALSSVDIDWEQFTTTLRSEGEAVYVGAGGPVPPGLTDSVMLHPVGLHIIETVTDYGVPPPEQKDLVLPRANVYRLVSRIPDLALDSVPVSRRIQEVRFGDHLSLIGFGGPMGPQQIGASPKLSYYWVVDQPVDIDYYVKVHLVDSSGSASLLRGLPVWDHSHLIGGLTPTSTWTPGVIMGERYDTLISWRIQPGEYAVKAWVYEDAAQTRPVPPSGTSGSTEGVILGYMTVSPREGPLDVALQRIPRE